MIKGKTLIELTDVKTGVTEVIREKNMVTNMLKSIYGLSYLGSGNIIAKQSLQNLSLSSKRSDKDNFKLIGDLIGGVLCYSAAIPENVNTYFASFDNVLTAHAATNINDDHNNLKRGSFNEQESGPVGNNGYKFVWDFATNQGNGEISSVCLTSYLGGLLGDIQHAEYLLKTKQLLLNDVNYSSDLNNKKKIYQYVYSHMIEVNIEENIGTSIGFVYKDNKPKIIIWKVRLPLTKMFLSASGGLISPIISEYEVPNTEVSSDIYSNIMNQNGYRSIVCSDDEHFYIITQTSLTYMLKIKKSDMSMEKMELDTSLSGNIWGYLNIDNYENKYGENKGIVVKDGKLYIGGTNGKIVIIDANTGALLGEIITFASERLYKKSDGISSYMVPSYGGYEGYFCKIKDLTYNQYTLKGINNYYYNMKKNFNSLPIADTPFFIGFNPNLEVEAIISTFSDYLVTINNLQTPVTKTADKTMKITYIIEEA